MAFKPIYPPSATKPTPQHWQAGRGRRFVYMIRETLSLSTWLLVGALLQSIIVLVIPRFYASLPILLVLVARMGDTVAITYGWKRNPYLDGAVFERTSPQIPDRDGNFHDEASAEKVVVFLLGVKFNHPLGIFAPNVKELGEYFNAMLEELNRDATKHGYLGGSTWTNQDKKGATELLLVSYWRSTEDVHQFAYGPIHRQTWDWWTRTIKQNDHIGINHEIFEVDRQHWEAVYLNFQPTLLGATTFPRKGDKDLGGTVDDQWVSPLMDASRGKLRSSAGRLGRDPAQLYDQYTTPAGVTRDDSP